MRIDGDRGFYAEVEPAPSGRRPWPGRMARWWFEVMGPSGEECCPIQHFYRYDGGGLSLRRCVWNAVEALSRVEEDDYAGVVKT